ncbi:MAG: cyclin-dependent kinase inhibitor 3 family protein [Microcoleaceae cyanobacterium]
MISVRTSENDPIVVDFLPQKVVGMKGRLGMTFAPGKQHQGMHFVWNRDLFQDLDRLQSYYKVNWLVSLIESLELTAVKIPDLFSEAHVRGMQTLWLPIPDMRVPQSMPEVVQLVQDILELLKQGNTVVIHCMGGLGRTGVITACCLIAFGYPPEEAIALVRQTRQYTIETQQQEEFVAQFKQAWTPDSDLQSPRLMLS